MKKIFENFLLKKFNMDRENRQLKLRLKETPLQAQANEPLVGGPVEFAVALGRSNWRNSRRRHGHWQMGRRNGTPRTTRFSWGQPPSLQASRRGTGVCRR